MSEEEHVDNSAISYHQSNINKGVMVFSFLLTLLLMLSYLLVYVWSDHDIQLIEKLIVLTPGIVGVILLIGLLVIFVIAMVDESKEIKKHRSKSDNSN